MRRAVLLALIAACGGSDSSSEPPLLEPTCQPQAGMTVTFREVAETVGSAVLVTSPHRDPRRFVVEQDGRIRILDEAGAYQPADQAFLDISETAGGPVVCCGEQGLLGLAFHPNYAKNGTFYVFYTTANKNILASYQVKPGDPSHADPASGKILISIDDFASNHNGGMLEFGRDGYLYIGTGDGGSAGDPARNGQNKDALLAKILRIDVDHPTADKPYGIPKDNPFANGGGAPEVYMLGLRNPWRWSFDQITGDMWIGDVGQDEIEELDFVKAGQGAGLNFGWSMYEADKCFHAPCDAAGIQMPIWQETHANGWVSIIGGQVYRGGCMPDLAGKYLYTDYGKHQLFAGTLGSDGKLVAQQLTVKLVTLAGQTADAMPQVPSSLHADARGELYLTTSGANPDAVWHLEVSP